MAPQPAEMNNDMMWHDPNPKQKKVQRDTGTSVWGDPNAQQVVRLNFCCYYFIIAVDLILFFIFNY